MVWLVNQQMGRGRRSRMWGGACLCWLFLMMVTPKVSLSSGNHLFADMRNILGVPNTLNVITNFPFLVVGVMGLVLSLGGDFFDISLRGELWGWLLFYGSIAVVAFGSAYYHLKPDDSRVMWDTLPMMIAYSSLFSSFILERLGEMVGICCLFSLLFISVLSTVYARLVSIPISFFRLSIFLYFFFLLNFDVVGGCRTFNDLRLCMTFQLIPCVVIPVLTFMFPPKYTHSGYWFCAAGLYILAKIEGLADMKVYRANKYIISGHSLEHLCSAAASISLTIMLVQRHIKIQRLGDTKERC